MKIFLVADILHTTIESASPMKLSAIINTQIDSRNREILHEVCGLSSGKPASMRSVGHRHGLTAERVRQIVAQARDRLFLAGKQEELALSKLCHRLGSPSLPVLVDDAANQKAQEIFGEPVTLIGLNNLLLIIGRETGHQSFFLGNSAALIHKQSENLVPLWRRISVAAKRIARSRGAVCAEDIVVSVSRKSAPVSLDLAELYLSVMSIRESFVLEGVRWYIFDEMPNMVRRAIFFCQTAGPLSLDYRNSVIYPPSAVGNGLPLQVVSFVLANYGFRINDGEAVLCSKTQVEQKHGGRRRKGLSKIQEAMIMVLANNGPMKRTDFLDACTKIGISRVTATIYLYRGYFINVDGVVSLPAQLPEAAESPA